MGSLLSFAEGEKIRLPLVSAIAEPLQAIWQRFFAEQLVRLAAGKPGEFLHWREKAASD